MNARTNLQKITVLLTLFILLLSACSPARIETAVEEQSDDIRSGESAEGEVVAQEEFAAGDEKTIVQEPVEAPAVILAEKEVASQSKESNPLPMPTAPANRPAEGNTFEHYGVNPFTDTYEDHLSTFALDVDTAAYSVARRYIQDGSLPPAGAVRVEEFVNYFDQDYPTPPDIAFGIYADGAPSPFAQDNTHILRFGIQGYEVAEWERKPTALTFVIDTSGSMGMENRLELVKRSLELLVERLRPDDSVSIIEYGSQAAVILKPTSGSKPGKILDAIYRLQPGGSTNAHAGLKLGYQMAMQSYLSGGVNRVILCSDGVANVGPTDPQDILDEVRGYVQEGVFLTSIGVGMGNFNDVFLEQLADNGNGNYAYIDTMDEAQKLFVDDLVANLQVIALDAKVQVDFNSDVVAYYRLIGYENRDVADEDFRDDTVDAGEIGAGHSATAMYAVVLKPGTEGRIATVQLRWTDPDSYQVKEINGNFNTWDLDSSYYQADPYYQLAVLVTEFAEILRHSPWSAETTITQLHSLANELDGRLLRDPDINEFVDLLGMASRTR